MTKQDSYWKDYLCLGIVLNIIPTHKSIIAIGILGIILPLIKAIMLNNSPEIQNNILANFILLILKVYLIIELIAKSARIDSLSN